MFSSALAGHVGRHVTIASLVRLPCVFARETSLGIVFHDGNRRAAYRALFAAIEPDWLIGTTLLDGVCHGRFCIAIRYARPRQLAKIRRALTAIPCDLLAASELTGLPLVETYRVERDVIVIASNAVWVMRR